MKRKQLQRQRKLFVETPLPKKKKVRKLIPGLEREKIPFLTKDGRIAFRPLFPFLQQTEDPIDRALKDLDYIWKSVEWSFQEQARQEALEKLEPYLEEGLEGVVKYSEAGGFLALKNQRVVETLIHLQQIQTTERNRERCQQASKWIKKIWDGMKRIVSGRIEEISPAEKKAIVADCKKWRPICEGLNKVFKQLWEEPQYAKSELYRKEARGSLAKKFSISVAEVEAIEWFLKKPSRRASKSTPFDATLHRVAREFPGRGEKTIEKVWQDYFDHHPAEKRKRRKTPTIPVVERIP
ncbi:MAG: hypothetical protein HYZ72_01450 [Deltaproteobacteria bacterium]|nr:hypothetical protein [Deltaproteobacteria bacterium]